MPKALKRFFEVLLLTSDTGRRGAPQPIFELGRRWVHLVHKLLYSKARKYDCKSVIDGNQTAGRFVDRHSAGRQLADALEPLISSQDTVILALPRGGVPVAREVAHRLGAPLDVLLVRKLGVPWQPELAFGAIATGNVVVFNEDHMTALGIGEDVVHDTIERERHELERRESLYRNDSQPDRSYG